MHHVRGRYRLIGLSADELDALAPDELDERASRAACTLREAGADHVIDTVADLPALLERLESGNG